MIWGGLFALSSSRRRGPLPRVLTTTLGKKIFLSNFWAFLWLSAKPGSLQMLASLPIALRYGSQQTGTSLSGPSSNISREPSLRLSANLAGTGTLPLACYPPRRHPTLFCRESVLPLACDCLVPDEWLSATRPLPISFVPSGLCRELLSAKSLPRGFCRSRQTAGIR